MNKSQHRTRKSPVAELTGYQSVFIRLQGAAEAGLVDRLRLRRRGSQEA